MAKSKNYGAMTRALTGVSTEQYKAAYTKFAARVRNYNAVAGTNYSATREFYYSFKYADDPTPALRAIEATPATRARTAGAPALSGKGLEKTTTLATDVIMKKWSGFIASSQRAFEAGFGGMAANIADKLEKGEITPSQANIEIAKIAKEAEIHKMGYEAYFKREQRAGRITQAQYDDFMREYAKQRDIRKEGDPSYRY